MSLVNKLPELEDAALAVLQENAERLEQTGTKTQRAAAAALLPAIQAEVATRREAKQRQLREAAAARRSARPKATKTGATRSTASKRASRSKATAREA